MAVPPEGQGLPGDTASRSNFMKSKISNALLALVFLIGLALLLYPGLSDWWNSFRQSEVIANYTQTVSALDEEANETLWNQAQQYNQELDQRQNGFSLSEAMRQTYESILNPGGDGVMGYVEIPCIGVNLPIYHGTDDAELQAGVGHLEWTSLPVGGQGTHCALSGHRGLPSAKLLSNLDKVQEGDLFVLHILGEKLTYQVDQIRIVEPNDVSCLAVEDGRDLCTLITCTPYGVNTQRLLVRGLRIENQADGQGGRITADAVQLEPLQVASLAVVPLLLVLLVALLLHARKKK